MSRITLLRLVLLGTMLSLSLAENLVCGEQMNEGIGDNKTLQYYYDQNEDVCRPFYYKGTGGNENRFESDRKCIETCSPKAGELYPTAEEVCNLPVNYGSCFALLLKYYYDTTEGNCRLFHYGGCQGNGNRFDTREDCQTTCMARSGRFAGAEIPNPDEASTSAGVVVGILGAVVFAGAVIMALLMFLKQRKDNKASRKGRPQEETPAMEMH